MLADSGASSGVLGLDRPRLVSATRPQPMQDPISVFTEAGAAASRALWLRPATGEALLGLGSAHCLVGSGPDRFKQIETQWRRLLADAESDGATPGPVLLGGFGFDPAPPATRLWADFPQARMVLPERLVSIRDGACWLTTNVVRNAPDLRLTPQDPQQGSPAARPGLSADEWRSVVGTVARGIREMRVRLAVFLHGSLDVAAQRRA